MAPAPHPRSCPSPVRPRAVGRAARVAGTVVVVWLAAACAAGSATAPPPDPASPTGANALVVRVVDGDTLVLDIGGTEETARLIGIDTPETKRPGTPIECYGPEASARLEALLPAGTPVRVELDREARDRYGRLLVYVHRELDGAFVNEVLVAEGYADELAIAPNTAFRDRFADAAAAADASGAGLWGACAGAHVPAGG